jgi:hypothetical protein
MRWRQVYNEEKGKYELVPITDSSRAKASSADIHGDIEPFRSPVDGSVISDRKQLREHNKRNNVVGVFLHLLQRAGGKKGGFLPGTQVHGGEIQNKATNT